MSEERIRVLFVDDEEGNLKAFKSTFRRDMEVLLAHSGQEALDLLEREEVHLIISDQRMPGMTGSEFLAIARERHPRAMRMLLTGYADLEAVVQAVNQGGIYAYATKPWDENDLKLRIEQAFEVQTLRAEKDDLLQQYRQVFVAAGDPIALVDPRGRIIEANAACAKLLGSPLDELPGKGFAAYLENAKDLVRSLKKNRRGTDFVNVDLSLRKADGSIVDCLMTVTYLGRQGREKDVFQTMIKDVSDRKQEENRLRKLNTDLDKRVAVRTAQLLEALEDLGSFSYSVAHDLRSPLKNIVALSGHLHMHAESKADTDACAFTERIRKGAQRLIDLVDDLLRFSQTNTREMEKTTVDLPTLVRSVIEEQVPEQRHDQVVLEIQPDARLLADAPMIKVVLHNLLSNALKFTRHKDTPHIVIGHQLDGERDIITVRDNGVGFDARQKDHVFGVFKRMHQADQFEGTGVGLAIVQRIVSKHGGEAWVESTVGEGTTISIALPRHNTKELEVPYFRVA